MFKANTHLRTLGPAPTSAAANTQAAPVTTAEAPSELPADYFRKLLIPRCKRDGICDDCGQCMH